MSSTASGIINSRTRSNRVTLRKTVISCLVLAVTLLLSIVLMSLVGSETLPARASLCALASFGTNACGLSRDQFDILFQIRLPRILLAAAVGGSLATAGAGYQALLRNPLAEPYLLGISNGAAVGTMIALVFSARANGRGLCLRSRALCLLRSLFIASRAAVQARRRSV